jgi:hypothetical protein
MKEHLCKALGQKDPLELYKEAAFPMPWLNFHEEGTVIQKRERNEKIVINITR